MTDSSSTSEFHQWLMAAAPHPAAACSIVLHCPESHPCSHLIQEIAAYLNEYDDDGDGRWLPATPELIGKISRDGAHRQRLGLPAANPPDPSTECHQTLKSLSQRGHVVFRSPGATPKTLDLAHSFHAGVGSPSEIREKCHLILNSELLDQKCIAHIIGDVFLEWLHCETRRGTAIHEIR